MADRAWRFGTTTGVVTVGADAVTISSTPRQFVAGQSARWRHGDRWERGRIAISVLGFLLSVALLGYQLFLLAAGGTTRPSALVLTTAWFLAYTLWNEHGRRTTIPRSALSSVHLDADERRLEFVHETADGPLAPFRADVAETTLTLRTADDRRRAREILRLRGIDLEPAPVASGETETTYRVVTRDGACFCERCRRQVSPSDGVCPACEYALRVETSVAE